MSSSSVLEVDIPKDSNDVILRDESYSSSSETEETYSEYSYFDDSNFPYEKNIFELNREYIFLKRLNTNRDTVVYKAEHRESKKIVAIKITDDLNYALEAENNLKNNKPREINIMQKLQGHPNICKFLQYIPLLDTNCYATITEFIDCTEDEIKPDQLKFYMYDVLQAIKHIHQNKIIYRDLKPSNILYSTKDKHAILIDFDCSTFFNPIKGHYGEIGTAFHYAPEMSNSEKKKNSKKGVSATKGYTTKVDIFAAGMTFAELFFDIEECSIPYREIIDIIKAHAKENGMRPEFDLIVNMLNPDPKKRFNVNDCLNHHYFNVCKTKTKGKQPEQPKINRKQKD